MHVIVWLNICNNEQLNGVSNKVAGAVHILLWLKCLTSIKQKVKLRLMGILMCALICADSWRHTEKIYQANTSRR